MISTKGKSYRWKVADTGEEFISQQAPKVGTESTLHQIILHDLDITLGCYFMGEVIVRPKTRANAY